jgi:hypothetical protein
MMNVRTSAGRTTEDDQSPGDALDTYLFDGRAANTVLHSTGRIDCSVSAARGAPSSVFGSENDPCRPVEQLIVPTLAGHDFPGFYVVGTCKVRAMYVLDDEIVLLRRPKKHQNCPGVVCLCGVVVQAQSRTCISRYQTSRKP